MEATDVYKALFMIERRIGILRTKITEMEKVVCNKEHDTLVIADYVIEQQELCHIVDGCKCILDSIKKCQESREVHIKHGLPSIVVVEIHFDHLRKYTQVRVIPALTLKLKDKFTIRDGVNYMRINLPPVMNAYGAIEPPPMTDEHLNQLINDVADLQMESKRRIAALWVLLNNKVNTDQADIDSLIIQKDEYAAEMKQLIMKHKQLEEQVDKDNDSVGNLIVL